MKRDLKKVLTLPLVVIYLLSITFAVGQGQFCTYDPNVSLVVAGSSDDCCCSAEEEMSHCERKSSSRQQDAPCCTHPTIVMAKMYLTQRVQEVKQGSQRKVAKAIAVCTNWTGLALLGGAWDASPLAEGPPGHFGQLSLYRLFARNILYA